jgi:hypothetical protein
MVPEAIASASGTAKILVHELAHAFKSFQIGQIMPAEIIEKASNGSLSYSDSLLAYSNMGGIYKAPPEVDFITYQQNHHEKFAFSTEHAYQTAAKQYGLTPERETFTADHPLHKNLVAAGVA